jgi:hypothetical protein
MMKQVRVVKKCLVKEYRWGDVLSVWEADTGDIVDIGNASMGFSRQIEPKGVSLADLGGDASAWQKLCQTLYENMS